MGKAVELDLFGDPVPQVRGPGRPAHVATAENRQFVNMLFVCGYDVMSVAKAMKLSRTAFYEHYRPEIDGRKTAALKFKGHQLLRLNKQAQAGSVAAEKALAGMIAGEQLRALGDKVKARGKASGDTAPAPAPMGKKESQKLRAASVGPLYAMRPPPSLAN